MLNARPVKMVLSLLLIFSLSLFLPAALRQIGRRLSGNLFRKIPTKKQGKNPKSLKTIQPNPKIFHKNLLPINPMNTNKLSFPQDMIFPNLCFLSMTQSC